MACARPQEVKIFPIGPIPYLFRAFRVFRGPGFSRSALLLRLMHLKPVCLAQLIALGLLEVGFHHGFHQFREADLRFPAQHGFGLGGIAEQNSTSVGRK